MVHISGGHGGGASPLGLGIRWFLIQYFIILLIEHNVNVLMLLLKHRESAQTLHLQRCILKTDVTFDLPLINPAIVPDTFSFVNKSGEGGRRCSRLRRKARNPSRTISSVIPKRKSACKTKQMPSSISDTVTFPKKLDPHPRVNRVFQGITESFFRSLFLTLGLGIRLVYQGFLRLWWICVVYQLFLHSVPQIHNTKSHICPSRCALYSP